MEYSSIRSNPSPIQMLALKKKMMTMMIMLNYRMALCSHSVYFLPSTEDGEQRPPPPMYGSLRNPFTFHIGSDSQAASKVLHVESLLQGSIIC
uniref:Uncharacterized protein n=1 Tax=Anguilla anguilla TaxID=7936 RepID=A0A0E9WV78_ANGAN